MQPLREAPDQRLLGIVAAPNDVAVVAGAHARGAQDAIAAAVVPKVATQLRPERLAR